MTAVKPAEARRALDAADPAVRCILVYGPDEAASRALAARLGPAVGSDAERIDLTGSALKADPARLADEAAAFSMFGGRRWIRVEPVGDEATEAVAALLEAAAAGNPVVLIAGELRKDSKLVKLVTAAPNALACINYLPDASQIDRVVADLGREAGLSIAPDVARRLATLAAGDRAVIAQEIGKYADYLDAAPDRRRELGHDALDSLAPAEAESDWDRLLHAVFAGEPARVAEELARLDETGIPLIRALQRRLLLLTELSAQVAAGNSIDTAVKSNRTIFWKTAPLVTAELRRWSPDALAAALARVTAAGRAAMQSTGPGTIAAEAAALDLARIAARRR
ncbi:DNA polymerase III subunit delta [Sphingomonas jatrophae]|uniref:DNA-directed DNA polymerase n=1 Tax=Sphingomonas jatrophae TaxID=1166337 RepID=A0A1I6LN66_9SPHN|nr:DNA polymerase III subunit delta [Sphingomonas jatrophae]SFS04967.1 DNA polymerase III, delta subunit [Sphingomonas jatrophae]